MSELQWRQMSDTRIQASADGWTLTIERKPNYARSHPGMVYDYEASAVRGGPWDVARARVDSSERHDLGAHISSSIARDRCASFLHSAIQQQKG